MLKINVTVNSASFLKYLTTKQDLIKITNIAKDRDL